MSNYAQELDYPYPLNYEGGSNVPKATADTDDIEGFVAPPQAIQQDLGDMTNIALPQEFTEEQRNSLNLYTNMMGRINFQQRQIDNLGDWENQQIERSREEMESGDRPSMSGFDLAYFHYTHPDGTTRFNAETWDNNDMVAGNLPPYMRRAENEMNDLFGNDDINHNVWLGQLGLPEDHPLIEELDEEIGENSNENDRYDGGWGYWREDYRPVEAHPNFEFMYDELREQDRIMEDDDGEARPMTEEEEDRMGGDEYERVFGEERGNVSGYRTSAEEMESFKAEIEENIQDAIRYRNEWLSQFQVEGAVEENQAEPLIDYEQMEQQERTGEEDLVALPSRRVVNIVREDRSEGDIITLGKRIQIKRDAL